MNKPYSAVICVGDVIDMTDKRIKEKKSGAMTLTLDIRSEDLSKTVRLSVQDPDNWMYENKGKVVAITRVENTAYPSKGRYVSTDLVNVILEKTTEPANKKSLLVDNYRRQKKPVTPVNVEMPALTPEKVPEPVKKPKPKKNSEKPFGIGLDSFLDALHDEDLSGVKATDEELPFN